MAEAARIFPHRLNPDAGFDLNLSRLPADDFYRML
jgi:hypothetical protein